MWKVAGEIEQLLSGRDRELVKTSLTTIYIGKAVGSLNLVWEESRISQQWTYLRVSAMLPLTGNKLFPEINTAVPLVIVSPQSFFEVL